MMDAALDATEVTIGFHPDGYRIDKAASPMNRYAKWDIQQGNRWCNPKTVCFDSLPQNGWFAKDKIDWESVDAFLR
jgi:hypothetical protein